MYVLLFTDPIVNFELTTANFPTIYQPLILQCIATIVRGITSTVDIIWTTGNTQVRRVNDVTASSNTYSRSIYNDSFIIPSLKFSDIGNVYECRALIGSTRARKNYTIPIPGIFLTIYNCVYFIIGSLHYHHVFLILSMNCYVSTIIMNDCSFTQMCIN